MVEKAHIFYICGIPQAQPIQLEPGVGVKAQHLFLRCIGNWGCLHLAELRRLQLLLCLSIGPAITKAINDFPGSIPPFAVTGFPSPILALENIFPCSHTNIHILF